MTTITAPALRWHRGTGFANEWTAARPEFYAVARKVRQGHAYAWHLSVRLYGYPVAEGPAVFRTLAEAKAEAQRWADTLAEAQA